MSPSGAEKCPHVKFKVGLPPSICEAIYMKYMHGVQKMTRSILFVVLGFRGCFRAICLPAACLGLGLGLGVGLGLG